MNRCSDKANEKVTVEKCKRKKSRIMTIERKIELTRISEVRNRCRTVRQSARESNKIKTK